MSGRLLPVQLPLNGNRALLADAELSAPVRHPVDGVRHLTLAALVRVRGFERLQALAHLHVLVHRHFDVGPFELRLVVVDVAQLDHHPRIRHVILIVIVVFALWGNVDF